MRAAGRSSPGAALVISGSSTARPPTPLPSSCARRGQRHAGVRRHVDGTPEIIAAGPQVVKPNRAEQPRLSVTSAVAPTSWSLQRRLAAGTGATVLASDAEGGSGGVSGDGALIARPPVCDGNATGAGDALAGFVHAALSRQTLAGPAPGRRLAAAVLRPIAGEIDTDKLATLLDATTVTASGAAQPHQASRRRPAPRHRPNRHRPNKPEPNEPEPNRRIGVTDQPLWTMAFDHRNSLRTSFFGLTGPETAQARAPSMPSSWYSARWYATEIGIPTGRPAILIDEKRGRRAGRERRHGIVTAVPVEASGNAVLEFFHGDDGASGRHSKPATPTTPRCWCATTPATAMTPSWCSSAGSPRSSSGSVITAGSGCSNCSYRPLRQLAASGSTGRRPPGTTTSSSALRSPWSSPSSAAGLAPQLWARRPRQLRRVPPRRRGHRCRRHRIGMPGAGPTVPNEPRWIAGSASLRRSPATASLSAAPCGGGR